MQPVELSQLLIGKLGDKRVAPGWIPLPTTETGYTQGTTQHTAI